MKHYLSIDVDYWWDYWDAIDALRPLFKKAKQRRIPINAVMNHQQLLPYVNTSKAKMLINVDQHSDVNSSNIDFLECGTWVSYIKWRHKGEYLWVRNYCNTRQGNCNGSLHWDEGADWGKIKSDYCDNRHLDLTEFINGCCGIGFCMSPNYSRDVCVDAFRDLVRQFNIPYTKGRKAEEHRRNICPPFRKISM